MTDQNIRNTKINKDRKKIKTTKNVIFYGLIGFLAAVTLAALIIIIGYILINGLSHINLEFLTEEPRRMGKEGGIFSIIIGTLYVTGVGILIATPIGIAAAVYFTEYAKEGKGVTLIRFFTEILAGIPSIIFGLFGFAFFVIFLGMGWSVLSGGLTLAMMVLPTLIRATEESLKTVPMAYREGSLSLGATKWQTIIKVIIPCCKPGILTGLILGIGRAIGETAAIMLTVGGSLRVPDSLFDSTRTMAVHLYILSAEGLSQEKTYATAALLIVIVLLINTAANLIGSSLGGRNGN
ncbi:phosphate ABC transporter permease PstA [Sinanaerobacter chloroacetimidivorans]|uniref:Phosphate transport system permease protein PstA n=1 Tax=Sinanaerobacter chloroacetimidivorans TaxID=2818044 RepID=A0A8J7VYR4_9FIRM|nr:phosphate ABC transporter permease PstA [Sinanaerobacter chloroacetimidivorans]MBR0597141.1 phosphate ABC transporter permease PstA [Sinanaerobacter chloroacetimidivorans]